MMDWMAPPAPALRKTSSGPASIPLLSRRFEAMSSRIPSWPWPGGYLARSGPSRLMAVFSASDSPSKGTEWGSALVTEKTYLVSAPSPGGISTGIGSEADSSLW